MIKFDYEYDKDNQGYLMHVYKDDRVTSMLVRDTMAYSPFELLSGVKRLLERIQDA